MDLRLSAEEAEEWDKMRADAGLRSGLHLVRALIKVRGIARAVLVAVLRDPESWTATGLRLLVNTKERESRVDP